MEEHSEITNQDLYERMRVLESKVDVIFQRMEQATGAWTFVKIVCSLAVGIAVMWNSLSSYIKH